jgi:hypothetical protein
MNEIRKNAMKRTLFFLWVKLNGRKERKTPYACQPHVYVLFVPCSTTIELS